MAIPMADETLARDASMMTLTGHLKELRRRLITSIVALVMGTILAQFKLDAIMHFLTAPAGTLYFLKPAEAFFIYFKTALTSGAIIASPVLFYQFWAFIVPAFTRKEKSILILIVPASIILFLLGIIFGFFVVMPKGLQFFMAFSSSTMQPMISMESYLDFTLMLVLPFGLVFNLPLVLLVLAKAGLVTSRTLSRIRRYVIFFSFVAAAVITPTTDIVSQCFLAVPIILLFEITRIIIRYVLHY
jgi:sec-independent protein translocase protein TatC